MAGKRTRSKARSTPYEEARRKLSRRDPKLRDVIRRIGPCTLAPNREHFSILVRTIISQQISTKAAISIGERLQRLLGSGGFTPENVCSLSDEAIRACGLSGGKLKSLRDLCAKVLDDTVSLAKLHKLPDHEVKESLIQIHGIGPWSADMFLMFSLGRMDILPVGDFGLRAGVKKLYELAEMPTPAVLEEIAELWQPYRSVATWYIWRSLGAVPQS
jgi:DNA-3-methyladenine glycosylase II